jgi:hypothetical protein
MRIFYKYTLILAFFMPISLSAQLYLEGLTGIEPFNICDCSIGPPVTTATSIGIATGSNLNPYYISNDTLFMYNLSNGSTVLISVLPFFSNNLVFGPDGLLYTIGNESSGLQYLYSINPNTGVVTNLGEINSYFPLGDLFFLNGELYCLAGDINGTPSLIKVPLGNPNNGTILFSYPNWSGLVSGAVVNWNGVPTVLVDATNIPNGTYGIHTLNMTTGELVMICPDVTSGDLAAPPGYSVTCCINDAGTFSNTNPITICENETVTLTHNGDEVLEPNASLTFLLLNNNPPVLPNNVVATSTTPTFSFNPNTMTTNTTYYIAAFAAPTTNGVPQWNASCKDLSLLIRVIWKPVPSVQLSAPPADLCQNGCVQISLQFTGDLPITLDWATATSNGPFTGSWTASATPSTFTLCAPAGSTFPTGNLALQWTGISNLFCTCD